MTEETQEIKTLTIDDVSYDVADMSDEAKALVVKYNRWNQRRSDKQAEAEAKLDEYRDELDRMVAALAELSRQIVARVRDENQPEPPSGDVVTPPSDE